MITLNSDIFSNCDPGIAY